MRQKLSGLANLIYAGNHAELANETKPKLEEASTHKSAKTHAGAVFTTRDLDL